ncbi:hypothetical protein EV424DRAFT_1374495, partial [Suillus variegatus]
TTMFPWLETSLTSEMGRVLRSISIQRSKSQRYTRVSPSFSNQGGFVGTKCRVEVSESSDRPEWQTWTYIHPEDANRRQTFDLTIVTDCQGREFRM